MGKYMKKGKITGDVAVMEIPQSTSLGVRTRARTLALQPNPELSYLQLRSRRLEKPSFQPPSPSKQGNPKQLGQGVTPKNPNSENQRSSSRLRVNSDSAAASASASAVSKKAEGRFGHFSDAGRFYVGEIEEFHDPGAVEPSFGENNLEFDGRERSTRESTPCSLIRDSEAIGTPGSTTSLTCSTPANRRARDTQRTIPTNPEMEEFFAGFEHNQQKLFIEKYNYDIKNDMPLPGRYEWVKVDN